MDVLGMIADIQKQAAAAGGRLDDLAVPQPLYQALLNQLGEEAKYNDKGVLVVNGTTVHMGEQD